MVSSFSVKRYSTVCYNYKRVNQIDGRVGVYQNTFSGFRMRECKIFKFIFIYIFEGGCMGIYMISFINKNDDIFGGYF